MRTKRIMEYEIQEQLNLKLSKLKSFYLDKHYEKSIYLDNNISLYTGYGSIPSVLYQLYTFTGEKKFEDLLFNTLQKIFNLIQKQDFLYPTFSSGLAGLGWLLLYLAENESDGISSKKLDIYLQHLDEFDEVLEETMKKMLEYDNIDIMHGCMGIGLYFLKRKKYNIANHIIEHLEKIAIIEFDEIKWKRFDSVYTKKDIYDFGLAHGNAAILYFLGKCYIAGCNTDKSISLINGLFSFYANNIQDITTINSYYPHSILVENYRYKANAPGTSRMAWCYGDLGILHTLFLVSEWVGNITIREKSEYMLLKTIMKPKESDSSLVESQFCHGLAGIATIALSAYKLTRNNEFKKTTDYWVSKILEDGTNPNRGIEGYLTYTGREEGWVGMVDMLSGLSGITSILVSYKNLEKPKWAEMFFLS